MNIHDDNMAALAHIRADATVQREQKHNGTELNTGGATFLAKITGNIKPWDNGWKYAWTEVELNGDFVSNKSGGRSGTTTTDYALNLPETYHTSQYAWGVDIDGTDYPAGFAARPVGGGGTTGTHKYDIVVVMRVVTDTTGNTRYVFSTPGSHDGECGT